MATSAEVTFAQRLASNEARDRHRALKKLRKYISTRASQTGFTREELRKLWKGLHYSMWMQDKPLLQEELATKISQLLLAFTDPSAALTFAAAFFATEGNEWSRLDHWRMDKFMMLVREFLRTTFEVVHRAGWEATLVDQVAQLIEDEVMTPDNEEVADGLRLHLAEIYLQELTNVGAEDLDGDQIVCLLQPFVSYISKSDRYSQLLTGTVIVDKVSDKIFGAMLQCVQNDDEEDESPRLKYDLEAVSKALLDSGRDKKCPQRNRAKLYKLVKRIQAVTGNVSQAKPDKTESKAKPEDKKSNSKGKPKQTPKKAKKRKHSGTEVEDMEH
ncbi:hypothetical protein BaRGS_00008920 [Batillaria attramentaria]|uniref:Uncharacterized protein n=1 Tax=Batillaria attramentaria TaxID=370345 RepID=A0ABD0LJX4_9CAEN